MSQPVRKRSSTNDQSTSPPSTKPKRLPTVQTSLENLPFDILLRILKYLPVAQWSSLELVHPNFRDAIHECWRSVRKIQIYDDLIMSIKYYDQKPPQMGLIDILLKLSARAVNLIDICGLSEWKIDDSAIELLNRFEKLQTIDFGHESLNVNLLAKFLSKSTNRSELKSIKFVNYASAMAGIQNRSRLVSAFHNDRYSTPLILESLDMEQRDHFTSFPTHFMDVMDVSRLHSFFCMNTDVLQDPLAKFITRAVNLQRLSFSFTCSYQGVNKSEQKPHYSMKNVPAKLVRQGNLRILEALGNHERLESLRMNVYYAFTRECECLQIGHRWSQMLAKIGQRGILKELNIEAHLALPVFLRPIAETLPNLESLTLCIELVDSQTLKPILRSQPNLKQLCLSAEDQDDICKDNFDIADLLGCAASLESLSLNFKNRQFTADQLKLLAQFHRLREFRLRDPLQLKINDSILFVWADGFGSSLETFVLSYYSGLTDKVFLEFLKKTPRLKHLQILACKSPAITDQSVMELPKLCFDLEHLTLTSSHAFGSADTNQRLIEECANLRSFYFHRYGEEDGEWNPGMLKLGKYRRFKFLSPEEQEALSI